MYDNGEHLGECRLCLYDDNGEPTFTSPVCPWHSGRGLYDEEEEY